MDDLLQQREHILAEFAGMVPVASMGIAITELNAHQLTLTAPLAKHVNDKGNAFGGSMASLLTLACWGLMTATVRGAGLNAHVYVGDSNIKYLHKVEQDLVVSAFFDDPNLVDGLIEQLKTKGKARLTLVAQVQLSDGTVAATLSGKFVAMIVRE